LKVVKKLNGDSSIKFKKKFELEEIEFYYDNEFVFTIRGWGHLTGVLKLSEIEAEKTQDDFALWILETLNS
jgi:GH24 family phage-related lysozyme (muramidase)